MNNTKTEESGHASSPAAPAATAPVAAPVSVSEKTAVTFEGLGISPQLLAVLAKAGFTTPTPIQHQAIPLAVDGKDVIGIAQTGTGKTLAFGIPMIQRLLADSHGNGLIVLPTRELAMQVDDEVKKLAYALGIRTAVLIGGASMYAQKMDIRRNPHLIICTPGRLIDHLEQRTLSLGAVRILVLDEADRMLDMGFAPQLKTIMQSVPKERQTMLFSATMPEEITKIAVAHMKLPLRIEVAPAGTSAENVEQEMIVVSKDARFPLLTKILGEHKGTVLVFSRTKHGAHRVCGWLSKMNIQAGELHSERSLAQRIRALDDFKKGRVRVLVATDIAARGIDVKNIELVLNYDLPDNNEDYVHRIGRTGRAGASGKAISFVLPDQLRDVKAIERLIRKQIPLRRHATVSDGEFAAATAVSSAYEPRSPRSRGGSSSRGGGGRSSFGGSGRSSHSHSGGDRGSFAPRSAGSRPPNPYYRVGLSDNAPSPRSSGPSSYGTRPPSRPYHARAPHSPAPRTSNTDTQKSA